jgi:hypothetical protein
VDEVFIVPSNDTPRIQETHITLGHALCALVEELLGDGENSEGATSLEPEIAI